MKHTATLMAAFVILISGPLSAGVQGTTGIMQVQQPKPASSGAYTLHIDAEEVVLNCTVLGNKGELVNDLTKATSRSSRTKLSRK